MHNMLVSRTITPRDVELLNGFGALQLSCGRPVQALPFLRLSYRLNPDEPQTSHLLAKAYLHIGNIELSVKYFTFFEKNSIEQASASALLLKSILQLKQGDMVGAHHVFMHALKKLLKMQPVS